MTEYSKPESRFDDDDYKNRWSHMDRLVRDRFHEFGNQIMRIEGRLEAINLRVPPTPADVPVLQEKVSKLETGQMDILGKIERVDEKIVEVDRKLNGLAIRVVGGTTIFTALVTAVIQLALK